MVFIFPRLQNLMMKQKLHWAPDHRDVSHRKENHVMRGVGSLFFPLWMPTISSQWQTLETNFTGTPETINTHFQVLQSFFCICWLENPDRFTNHKSRQKPTQGFRDMGRKWDRKRQIKNIISSIKQLDSGAVTFSDSDDESKEIKSDKTEHN